MEIPNIQNLKAFMDERRKHATIALRPIKDIIQELIREKKITEDGVTQFIEFINREIRCPERFAHAMPDAMPDAIKKWAEKTDGQTGLYIHGSVGTGKTFAIYALAKLLRTNKIKVRVKNLPEWFDQLRQYYERPNSDQELKDEFREECVLILDDLGTEKQTEWTTEIIYRLVNNRYEQVRPTIFASNLNLEELATRYGDRITSRIVEMVGGDDGVIRIEGDDRRLKT